eukprot:GHVP01046405.1.p1 GENE.GHVP01046405.1~~GHVP01046405.1.p1  ORF type:complete len:147 (+),score=19.28 GHVP01046405.1:478-918(+)
MRWLLVGFSAAIAGPRPTNGWSEFLGIKQFDWNEVPESFVHLARKANYYFDVAFGNAYAKFAKDEVNFYDYIVVGGGGAGCPFARTVADKGYDTLLIERGGLRKDHPLSMDISGAGLVVHDPDVSQLIVTTQGVRSHIGSSEFPWI